MYYLLLYISIYWRILLYTLLILIIINIPLYKNLFNNYNKMLKTMNLYGFIRVCQIQKLHKYKKIDTCYIKALDAKIRK